MADPKSGKKPNKLKARLPRGLADRGPAEIAATRTMVDKIRVAFERYGFEPLETPAIEYTDALGKFLPDQDRPNEGVFSFQDDDEQWLSLRYDLTAPLARYVAENYQHIAMPYRSYRYGWVFRNEKPGPGRFRQFMQFDADTVGAASMAADAEMCMLAADTMEALGIPRGSYVVKVNNRKVLDGIMDAIGIGGNENAGKRLTVLRAIDKLDRLDIPGVRSLLSGGRLDESGDFTKGAGLVEEQIQSVLGFAAPTQQFLESTVGENVDLAKLTLVDAEPVDEASAIADDEILPISFTGIDRVENRTSSIPPLKILWAWKTLVRDSQVGLEGVSELARINQLVRAAGYGTRRIRIDSSVVRGLEYYTGPVFEVELLIGAKDDKGRPVRFGSVGGGGRYDGLVSRFMGQPAPATGFSIGVSRLQAALTALGKLDSRPPAGPVLVAVFGADSMPACQKLAATLRSAGIRAEPYLGNPKHGIGQQLKYADRRGSPCAVIQLRDLIAGAAPSDTKDRDEYLKQQAQAQVPVKESELVGKVRELLARHGLK
jgi:histidyl-tRNA synthetase